MKKTIIAALALAVVGCSAKLPHQTKTGIRITDGGGSAEVQEIKLKDNTRCAVVVGLYKGAISCDWKSTP